MEYEPIARLTRDVKNAAKTLSDREARYLVDAYYIVQEGRKRSGNQVHALSKSGEPHELLAWFWKQSDVLEAQIAKALDVYSASKPIGVWSREIAGIGPIIAAGLMANIDLNPWYCQHFRKDPKKRCHPETPCEAGGCGFKIVETAGEIWRFAGLDPTSEWKERELRPWNARLKVLCWKIGESFVKVSGNPASLYGRIYRERKESEITKNEAGLFADQAAEKLRKFKIGKGTDAYKAYSIGKLPAAHIHARAKRYAVKLFLAHWFETAYRDHFKKEPPLPYAISILGHAHHIPASNAA